MYTSSKNNGAITPDNHSYVEEAEKERHDSMLPKYMILESKRFETIKSPSGTVFKSAYGNFYSGNSGDLDIELLVLRNLEAKLRKGEGGKDLKARIKFHYKRCIALISPKVIARGWNRWSDNMLDLFLCNKRRQVIWGSGNCGKSKVMAILIYIKWRINPMDRGIVIASKVAKEAETRVFGYLLDIHLHAPQPPHMKLEISNTQVLKGIFSTFKKPDSKQLVINRHGGIVNLPVKMDSKKDELGSNLLGFHPKELLMLAFDEAQELPGKFLNATIFANWMTNDHFVLKAWGNPVAVDVHNPSSHDLLFRLGWGKQKTSLLKEKFKQANKTMVWTTEDTAVLHISMLDSPKDDPDEVNFEVDVGNGIKMQRLQFLAGKKNAAEIEKENPKNSAAYCAQVLGFPYIEEDFENSRGVLTPFIVKESQKYPIIWKDKAKVTYYMGVDPAPSERRDGASIVVCRVGDMEDGRRGIDLFGGAACIKKVEPIKGLDYTDAIIENMWDLCKQYNIQLRNIAIDTNGSGDTLRYCMDRHFKQGIKWRREVAAGQTYYRIITNKRPTDMLLFKSLRNPVPAKEMCATFNTEMWVTIRCLVMTRQIFNVPDNILKQFYNRFLIQNKGESKYRLENKEELRLRGVPSPNEGDALAYVVQLIMQRGFKFVVYDDGYYDRGRGLRQARKEQRHKTAHAMGVIDSMLGLGGKLGGRTTKKEIPWGGV